MVVSGDPTVGARRCYAVYQQKDARQTVPSKSKGQQTINQATFHGVNFQRPRNDLKWVIGVCKGISGAHSACG